MNKIKSYLSKESDWNAYGKWRHSKTHKRLKREDRKKKILTIFMRTYLDPYWKGWEDRL